MRWFDGSSRPLAARFRQTLHCFGRLADNVSDLVFLTECRQTYNQRLIFFEIPACTRQCLVYFVDAYSYIFEF